jgi:hypothetical protein
MRLGTASWGGELVECCRRFFALSSLDDSEWSASHTGRFSLEERPSLSPPLSGWEAECISEAGVGCWLRGLVLSLS